MPLRRQSSEANTALGRNGEGGVPWGRPCDGDHDRLAAHVPEGVRLKRRGVVHRASGHRKHRAMSAVHLTLSPEDSSDRGSRVHMARLGAVCREHVKARRVGDA